MIKINWKAILTNISIPLILVGGLSSLLTMGSMDIYSSINNPPLAPPGWLFPIVWTILFILMGISSYIVWESESQYKPIAYVVYAVQLILNFIWSLVFFNLGKYWLAFVIIIALFIMICLNIYYFSRVNKSAGYFLIPYLLWVAFASYLNVAIAILNPVI